MPLSEIDRWLLMQDPKDLKTDEQRHRQQELMKSMGILPPVKEVLEDDKEKEKKPPAK